MCTCNYCLIPRFSLKVLLINCVLSFCPQRRTASVDKISRKSSPPKRRKISTVSAKLLQAFCLLLPLTLQIWLLPQHTHIQRNQLKTFFLTTSVASPPWARKGSCTKFLVWRSSSRSPLHTRTGDVRPRLTSGRWPALDPYVVSAIGTTGSENFTLYVSQPPCIAIILNV